jgi:hypothetical protein
VFLQQTVDGIHCVLNLFEWGILGQPASSLASAGIEISVILEDMQARGDVSIAVCFAKRCLEVDGDAGAPDARVKEESIVFWAILNSKVNIHGWDSEKAV